MMIEHIALLPYRLGLKPVPGGAAAGRVPAWREGLLLRLTAPSGAVGWGEAAPLPGRSRESLAEARAQLEKVSPLLRRLEAPPPATGWSHRMLDALTGLPLPCASVRFAVESAVLDLLGRERALPWNRDYARDYARVLPLAALIVGAGEGQAALEPALEWALAEGFDTVKIKVGMGDALREGAALAALSARLGHRLRLRLDANRAWHLAEALAFARQMRDGPVEYLEEPLCDPAALAAFVPAGGMPVAIDEMLDAGMAALPALPIAAYVIKPMVHGGISGALRLAERACRRGATPVLSATFESGIGIRALVQLASVIHSERVPVGLDTHRWLAEDVLAEALPLQGARLLVDGIATAELRVKT